MEEKNTSIFKQQLIDKIIRVAYGDASTTEKIIVYWNVFRNDDIKKLLGEYKHTANFVHRISEEKIPENVVNSIRKRIELNSESENLLSKIHFALFKNPVFSAAIVVITLLGITLIFFFRQPTLQHRYSKAEIKIAQKQLGESIAILNKVFSSAEQKLDKDIINDRVNKQLNKSLNLVNDYLIGG